MQAAEAMEKAAGAGKQAWGVGVGTCKVGVSVGKEHGSELSGGAIDCKCQSQVPQWE